MTLDDNHLAVLRYVRDYSQKHPEIVPYIVAVTGEGIQAAMAEERAIRADMEHIAAVAVEKRFANRQEFIIGKLNKWRGKLCVNWDWFLGYPEKPGIDAAKVNGLVDILNQARCESQEVVGNLELANRILKYLNGGAKSEDS